MDLAEVFRYVPLIGLGVVIGAYGTLIGAGGGFVLVPILLLLYPHESAAKLTSVSLAVVFANATSGSFSYYRMRRVDYRSGVLLAAATVPGAILGAILVGSIPRAVFDPLMGITLLAVGSLLVIRPTSRIPLFADAPLAVERTLVDSEGHAYQYRFNLGLAVLLSIAVGFLSSLLGIGGGIIHVPMLVTFFAFPEHIATATSHFVLMIMSGAATGTHVVEGNFSTTLYLTVFLAIGVLIGAPFGAALSNRLRGVWIVRLLAVALAVVGLRLLLVSL
jgi:uncharacterized membrane protein YfcA